MKKRHTKTILLLSIYLLSLVIFNIHIEQYQNYFQEFPDEYSHIAYIAYLKQTKKIIPKFEKMQEIEEYNVHLKKDTMEKETKNTIEGEKTTKFLEKTTNHLGHPPLYYQIMGVFNLVKVDNGKITYNLKALRNISQVISNIALIIIFLYAYKNLKTIVGNFIFSMVLVNIPLLPYVSGAVQNDVLSFLGLGIFLYGVDKLIKNQRGYVTYLLIAISIFICMMNKVTTGLILIIAIVILFIYLAYKEKNLKFILRKEFLITIPIYVCILIYYIIIMQRYGTIQPTIQKLNLEYYKTTSFYDSKIYTKAYSLKMYAKIYWGKFINYWAGYNYGATFPKHKIQESLISLLIFSFPIIYLIWTMIKKKKIDILNLSICIGVYVAIVIQFTRQYIEFKTLSGYFGGYHSIYYLCAMPSFIILISKLVDEEKNKKIQAIEAIVTIIYIVLIQWMLFK